MSLESSTLTPLLKRLEAAGFLQRSRNPENERQVVIALTDQGRALQSRAGCLNEALLAISGQPLANLGELNREVRELRDTIYKSLGGWDAPV